jgi:hypothetical protein
MIDPSQLAIELMTQLTLFDGTPVKFKITYQNNHGLEFINIVVIGITSQLINRNNIGELKFDMYKHPLSGYQLYILKA